MQFIFIHNYTKCPKAKGYINTVTVSFKTLLRSIYLSSSQHFNLLISH